MNWFELGWMLVAFAACACAIQALLSKAREIYAMSLHGARANGIHEYGAGLRKNSYWFSGRDKALVEAIAEDMAHGCGYPRLSDVRDKHLPEILARTEPA